MAGQVDTGDSKGEIELDDIVWEDPFDDTLDEDEARTTSLRRRCPSCSKELPVGSRFCASCGSPVVESAQVPRGDPLAGTRDLLPDRYQIQKFLGRGAMGRVFLCKDRDLAVEVAVKVLLNEMLTSEEELEKMRLEARAAAKFRECPGILSLYTFDHFKGTSYLVMEFAAGGSLRARLRREHRLSEAECRRIGAEVAKSLAYAHRRQMIHRDIKPGNVLLDERWHAKIADFGIARALAHVATQHSHEGLIGTPAYVAPELIAGEPVDARADLYSLGCMLYEMATGELPFKGSFPEIAMAKVHPRTEPPDPSKVRAGLTDSFVRLVRCLLQRNPEHRFADSMRCAVALDAPSVSLEMTPTVEANLTESKNAILASALFKRAVKLQEDEAYESADGLLRRALALHEELFGDSDPVVARDLKYLARNHYLQGRFDRAQQRFARAITIREHALGANHPDIANDLTFMGRIHTLQGNHEEARGVYSRALGIMEKSVGRGDPSLVRLLNHLAVGHLKKGRPEQAGPLLDRALAIVELVKGRGHPSVVRTLNNIASLHLAVHDHRRCETTLNRALTILELAYGKDHHSLLDTLDLYAVLQDRQEKAESAARLRDRAEKIRG